MTNMENTIKGVLVIVFVLLGVTFSEWGHLIRPMLTLFDDVIAIGLLGLVLVLLTWYDCKLGLAFFVLIAFVLFNRQDISGVVEGFLATMKPTEQIEKPTDTSIQEEEQDKRIANVPETTTSQTEPTTEETDMTPTTTVAHKIASRKAKPTHITSHKRTKTTHAKTKSTHTKPHPTPVPTTTNIEGFASGSSGSAMTPCGANKDFNTYVDTPEYPGYDVAGGRFDFVNSTQNMTIHGPPLSWCPTYTSSVSKLPTPFYPLNA